MGTNNNPETYSKLQIIRKLIGDISPVGCSNRDAERLDNLRELCDIVHSLVDDIHRVNIMNSSSHEYSVKRISDYAHHFTTEILGIPE